MTQAIASGILPVFISAHKACTEPEQVQQYFVA